MSHKEIARELFVKGYNCSQAVFAAFCDEMGMDMETALKLSSSFGAGMGRMREVCGACSGMFMVAGLLKASADCDDKSKADHYKLIQDLAEKFKDKNNGTIICREILKNLKPSTTPAPDKRTEEYYKARPCLKFVEEAVEIIDEMLEK